MNSPPFDKMPAGLAAGSPRVNRHRQQDRWTTPLLRREQLGFPAQFALSALRRLIQDSADASGRQRVAAQCRTLGVPGALPVLVGLAGCLARGPRAHRLQVATADLTVSAEECGVLLALRDASAGRRPHLDWLVRPADLAAAAVYTHHSACELEASGLRITLRAPVIPLPVDGSGRPC